MYILPEDTAGRISEVNVLEDAMRQLCCGRSELAVGRLESASRATLTFDRANLGLTRVDVP